MKVWITAGGTGSAWHICLIVKKYYKDKIELYVSDTNESELVAASTLADHFFTVPPVRSDGYATMMYQMLQENAIDVIIPLIPWEQDYFAPDNEEFAKLGIKSIAPTLKTSGLLNNKVQLNQFCLQYGFPTISIIKQKDVRAEQTYFVKEMDGFGAAGARRITGEEILSHPEVNYFIQEYCGTNEGGNEITVEVFYNRPKIYTIARRRIEAKCGVCTKAEIVKVDEAERVIQKMAESIELPPVFNVQFIYHNEDWKVMDVNLRLAAGTGLSNAAGFQLIRSLFATILGENVEEQWLIPDDTIHTVLRVYEEVVIR